MKGIHHVTLEVENVEELVKLCEEKGMTLIARRFIHPRSTHGVLIELMKSDEMARYYQLDTE